MDSLDFDDFRIMDSVHTLCNTVGGPSFLGKQHLVRESIYELEDLLGTYFSWRGDMREAIIEFVSAYIAEHGYSPTTREIGDAVGISSTSHVSYWVDKLVHEGKLTKGRGIPRSVRVV